MVKYDSRGEKTFGVVNYVILTAFGFVTLYPFLYVVFASLSSPVQLLMHEGMLWKPVGLTFNAYRLVFNDARIYTGYANTLFYVVMGTGLNIVFSTLGAYVLSRPYLKLRRPLTLLCIFTMYFSGGLVPNYLLIQGLGLMNSRWSIILPGLVSTWNLMIMITAFRNVPLSLEESARIDGAGELRILLRIVVPLVLPTIMVMMLYYGVGHWNSWFNAMIYLRDRSLYPLQLFLREVLVENQVNETTAGAVMDVTDNGMTIKYATIIVSTLPILVVYPFVQRYFIHGVMIGAVKE